MNKKINILLFPGIWKPSFLRAFKSSKLKGKIFLCEKSRCDLNAFDYDIEYCDIRMSLNSLGAFVKDNNIGLVIMLDDMCTMLGYTNYFKYNIGVPTLGVTRYWAQLESSKKFGKEFMTENSIPTSQYRVVENLSSLKDVINEFGLPLVLKDDRPQCGFGSYICKTKLDCYLRAVKLLKENKFFVAEKFIYGEEVTLQIIWDGNVLIPLAAVRDYKRLKRNNQGINTGSMGCYLPVKLSENKQQMMQDFVKKLEEVFIRIKPNFTGIFAADLIFTENEVFNLEFNMRPCTPEFETFIEHINNDITKLFYDIASGCGKESVLDYKSGTTGCVNVFHNDYKKHITKIVSKKVNVSESLMSDSDKIKVNCSILKNASFIYTALHVRAFSVLCNDDDNPFPYIYKHLEKITDKNLFYRDDIGT